MNINIQISDSGAVSTSTDNGSGTSGQTTPGASGNSSDGGGPKASLTGGDNSSSMGGDTTDIGGPPQWLSDAIASEGQGKDGISSAPGSGGGDGQDAGTAPSFD